MSAIARNSLWILLLLGASAVQAGDARVAWRGWEAGLREAKQLDRPMLVDVYTDWCGWCKRMDRDVYARPEVREYLQGNFVTVKLDAEATTPVPYEGHPFTARSLSARFRVTGYPTTIFLKPDGEYLVKVPGYVESSRFLLLLRFIHDGHLERGEDFEAFARQASSP